MFKRRKQSAFEHCMEAVAGSVYRKHLKKKKIQRRPTLKHFFEECARRDSSIVAPLIGAPPVVEENFRLQQKYWGRVRSSSMNDIYEKEEQEVNLELAQIEMLRRKEDLRMSKKQKSLLKKKERKKTKKNEVKIKIDEQELKKKDSESEAVLMWPETLKSHRKSRAHSEPIIGTVERFEKVLFKGIS